MKGRFSLKRMSLRDKESLKGYVFFIPLIIGLITFFFIPTVKSFLFSISDVTSGADGYKFTVTGFSAYKNALFVHTSYRQTVIQSAIYVITTTPLVILFSFFMASVLNQNFRGKVFFRVVMFLPVILTVMNSQSNTLESSMGAYSSYKGADAAAVSFCRILISFLLFGNVTSLLFSLFGSALSHLTLAVLKKHNLGLSFIGISVLCALSHNAGQLAAA